MVPGESCFNLNFSNPGGSFGPPINLASPSGENGAETSSASSTAAAIIASVVSGVGPGPGNSGVSGSSRSSSSGNRHGPKFHQVSGKQPLPNGKKTKGRVKIKMEFIDNKLRRYTTFSKRKTGIMKKVSYICSWNFPCYSWLFLLLTVVP